MASVHRDIGFVALARHWPSIREGQRDSRGIQGGRSGSMGSREDTWAFEQGTETGTIG